MPVGTVMGSPNYLSSSEVSAMWAKGSRRAHHLAEKLGVSDEAASSNLLAAYAILQTQSMLAGGVTADNVRGALQQARQAIRHLAAA